MSVIDDDLDALLRKMCFLLDQLKATASDPEAWNFALYVAPKVDPRQALIAGNITPEQIVAGIAILEQGGMTAMSGNRDDGVRDIGEVPAKGVQ